jgi:cell division transport system ATP-binding protein
MKIFEQFKQVGVTVLIASHDLDLIAHMNHRLLTLKEGELVKDGHSKELLELMTERHEIVD